MGREYDCERIPLYADFYGTDEPGDAAVEVYYLTKTAEFNISIPAVVL